MPPDSASDHAVDFARRYAEDLEVATGQVMLDLGLPASRMGAKDWVRGGEHHTFYPDERQCGTVTPDGRILIDSGVMNPGVMDEPYGEECGQLWRRTRLRHRLEAIIAHEFAEHNQGDDHELALIAALVTDLPISNEARELLRAQERGWDRRKSS